MSDRVLRPRAGSSAKALLLTVLGECVLPASGAAWTATLIDAGEALGINERSVRQALTRLADDGVLEPRRHGRSTRWHLSEDGRSLLETGAARIYGLGASGEEWDGRWLVVMVTVSEEHRSKRHQLRSRLAFEGLGFVAPGVAVTPHVDREKRVNALLAELELGDDAIVFLAEAGSLSPDGDVMKQAWDLDELAGQYQAFADTFADRAPEGGPATFGALMHLVHEWRRFPFVDPEIPAILLPDDWPGHVARAVFARQRDAWTVGARQWFDDCETPAPAP